MRKKLLIGAGALIIIVFLITILFCSKSTPLPAYDASNDTVQPTQKAEPTWGTIYTDSDTGLTMRIPDEFTHVVKDGKQTFIHSATAAYYQISHTTYSPTILNENEQSLANELAYAGGSLVAFKSNSQYDYMFQYEMNGDVYLQRTLFDQNNLITVVFSCQEQYFKSFSTQAAEVIETVSYQSQCAFPNDMTMYYSSFGNLQFAIPVGWVVGTQGDAIYAADQNTGTEMIISVTNEATSFDGFSQMDYVNSVSQGYSRYVLSSYESNSYYLHAVGQYAYNSEQRVLEQYIMSFGEYTYHLYFTCETDLYDKELQTITSVANLTRVF